MLTRRPDAVDAGQITLLGEAHLCWAQGCYRAATVLIGVASEESLGTMLDTLANYPAQDTTPPARKDWDRVKNPSNAISARFEGGMSILRRLAERLRQESRRQQPKGSPPPWAALWFQSVEALQAIGEAVRCARNKAAHDATATFRRSDVALLLASVPTLLEQIADMKAFLSDAAGRLDPVKPPVV